MTDVERVAAKFHDLYQQEARRQGDVRHADAYADLPENIKEFDRVLARYVLEREASLERELAACKQEIRGYTKHHDELAYLRRELTELREANAQLAELGKASWAEAKAAQEVVEAVKRLTRCPLCGAAQTRLVRPLRPENPEAKRGDPDEYLLAKEPLPHVAHSTTCPLSHHDEVTHP